MKMCARVCVCERVYSGRVCKPTRWQCVGIQLIHDFCKFYCVSFHSCVIVGFSTFFLVHVP